MSEINDRVRFIVEKLSSVTGFELTTAARLEAAYGLDIDYLTDCVAFEDDRVSYLFNYCGVTHHVSFLLHNDVLIPVEGTELKTAYKIRLGNADEARVEIMRYIVKKAARSPSVTKEAIAKEIQKLRAKHQERIKKSGINL